MERVGLRLQLRKRQAEAGDIVLLYGDESEALTHPYLARAWAKSGEDLRVPAPGQAKKIAMLGSLDHLTRQLIVHTSPTKRSSDFIVHLEQLDRLYGPQPGRQAKPVVLVEDNGPIHTSKRSLAALAARAHWLTVEWLPNTRPNSMTSSRSGATSRPITSPTRPSPTPSRSTTPSTTPSQISTASGPLIRWPNWESLLRSGALTRTVISDGQDAKAPRRSPGCSASWPLATSPSADGCRSPGYDRCAGAVSAVNRRRSWASAFSCSRTAPSFCLVASIQGGPFGKPAVQ